MWLDTLIAVPVLGLQTVPTFNSMFTYPERLQPMLDEEIVRDHEIEVGYDRAGLGLQFRTKSGFSYKITLDNIVVEFAYLPREKRTPGRLPSQELPPLQRFSALADATVAQMAKLLSFVGSQEQPKVIRFGLAVSALLEKSKAPPGIDDLIKHHAAFFKGDVVKSQATFLVNIEKTNSHTDRCHHTYAFDDMEKPDDLAVTLDWQRVFRDAVQFSGSIEERLRPLKNAALAYFERVGQGGLKDA